MAFVLVPESVQFGWRLTMSIRRDPQLPFHGIQDLTHLGLADVVGFELLEYGLVQRSASHYTIAFDTL